MASVGLISPDILAEGAAIGFPKDFNSEIAVAFFGSFHGLAHGIEVPWAVNPLLFALGFSSGSAALHLFGVGIGLALIRNNIFNTILRTLGFICALFGFYLII